MSTESNDISALWDAQEARSKRIAADYVAGGQVAAKAGALVEYRCKGRRGCLLLHVWQSPDDGEMLYYLPAYKLSHGRNEADSVPEARAKNTTDGERRWRARGGYLDEVRGWGDRMALKLQCDHTQALVTYPEMLSDADGATPGNPTRRTL